MRKIKLTEEKTITIEAFARKQIESLKEYGFIVSTMSLAGVNAIQCDDFCDAMITLYCPDQAEEIIEIMKDLPTKEHIRVFKELMAETWGDPDEEKNLSRSGAPSKRAPGLS